MNDTFITKSGHYGTATGGGGGNEPVKKTTWNTYATGSGCQDAFFTNISFQIGSISCSYRYDGQPFCDIAETPFATFGKVVATAPISKEELQPALLRAYMEVIAGTAMNGGSSYNPATITVVD